MDFLLVLRLIGEKMGDRSVYVLALVVGTLINGYGQLLVPWLRSGMNPFLEFAAEFETRPGVALLSVFLGYTFPFCVSTYSSVATRYKNRRFESMADFPERKPDPVFRATTDGRLVEFGAKTRAIFEANGIDSAQKIFGEDLWRQIVEKREGRLRARFFFEAEDMEYVVSYARTGNDQINLYISPIPQ